ncbi:MAG TPA: CBS domain-containing protein [Nitrospira sp.]|mgnify:FL=1|nr:CBS domain-containing protein [Nitrospira sp.]MBS0179913.1 CBS domain-containing protein [Nitrospira sp.]HNK15618.1 CBS domain-containing protein [Nitrospira sp.]HNL87916.1 CBS domain-containing protein [Nitrospira sp.]HNN42339.1 CBS domain-containing protein [Nitrospira sp.]
MNDDHRHTDLPRPMPDGTRRPTAGIYRESIRNEQLGLLPGDVKQVKEVMSSKVTTATPRTSLTEAAGLMKKLDVPVVVVYDGARLKGMLTERDMALSQAIQRASPKAAIERFMRTSIPPCFDDDLLRDALDLMRASKLEWLPVLDRRHRLVGVLPIYVPQP